MSRITALEFSPQQFPLSPNMEEWAITETFKRNVVLVGIGKPENFDNYTTSFSEQEAGTLEGASDRINTGYVTVLNPDRHPIIVITFPDPDTGTVYKTLTLDYSRFMADFEVSQDSADPPDLNNDVEHAAQAAYETAWSIQYLKTLWGNDLSGPDSFWQKLYRDLDMTCMPLMLKAGLAEIPAHNRPNLEVTRQARPY